ncbi:MAG: hypothetical protein OEY51_12330 [Cyclobacteriaceae bacterium]|nr:hypothetical protein [Cyclobacteriaceae bacterium]
MDKILKLLWLISFVIVNITLFYVYAGLPEMVAYTGDEMGSLEYIGKELFFYFFLIVIGVINIVLYILIKRGLANKQVSTRKAEKIAGWKYGLSLVINIFLSISMAFISIFNSGEKFDYSNFGYLVYFSLGLVILWIISFPFVIYSARVKV